MAEQSHTYTRLPGKLRDELGISKFEYNGVGKSRNGPQKRKEARKAARVEKKKSNAPMKRKISERILPVELIPRAIKTTPTKAKPLKSVLKSPKVKRASASPSPSPPPKIERRIKNRLAEDDAEIAALEKVLGVKNSSKLPKSFEEDGLDDLLEGLEAETIAPRTELGKRKRPEGFEWLEKKRRKAQAAAEAEQQSNDDESSDEDISGDDDLDLDGSVAEDDVTNSESGDDGNSTFGGFDGEDDSSEQSSGAESNDAPRRVRENPYVAPPIGSNDSAPAKYVPPSLRNGESSQSENLSRLRKQVQGLLNRLSEANMLSIVGDVEKLYLTNPRQDASATILDVLIGLLSDPSSLQDTFLILHAGFIAALYKTVGTEFGAQAVQRIDTEFSQHYESDRKLGVADKRSLNLINLMAYLYNFQVISSVLMYDLIRQFLSELSDINTELLLKIVRSAGSQLRQDDPSSLKSIIYSLEQQIAETGSDGVSVKMKFMIEMMNDLKTNRMKTGIAASSIKSEHLIRMKKTLGTLNQKRVKASEPLRIGLKDLRESDRRGKWWLIGSSYKDEGQDIVIREAKSQREDHQSINDAGLDQDLNNDLLQLAKEQRMNTSIRQSIFITIMSATDYHDAHIRLIKLRLKKAQELEIPKVLLHCSKSEEIYNPYYTLLARKLTADRKLKKAFEFSLWDVFKQLDGEPNSHHDEDDDSDNEDTTLSLRAIVNLAKMYGSLIADGGLTLSVLKKLNLAYLQPNTQTFIEILLTTAILQCRMAADGVLDEKSVTDVFSTPKKMPDMARGLIYFVKKHVSKSDVIDGKQERAVVRQGCKVAGKALRGVMSRTMYET